VFTFIQLTSKNVTTCKEFLAVTGKNKIKWHQNLKPKHNLNHFVAE